MSSEDGLSGLEPATECGLAGGLAKVSETLAGGHSGDDGAGSRRI